MDTNASDTSTATMDFEAAADRIGTSLGEDLIGRQSEPTETPGLDSRQGDMQGDKSISNHRLSGIVPDQTTPVQTYEVPKSWKREMHEHWGKVTPEAQAYIIEREKQLLDGFQTFRPIQDALAPHQDFLTRSNLPPAQAVALLLNAQRRLTEGTVEQRRAAYHELGRNLQLLQEQAEASQAQPQVDPAIQSVQQKVSQLEQAMMAEREAQITVIRQENSKIVDAFAADTKAHPYFDEVANEMAALISQGQSLQDAYENAVWLNPATRTKELARAQTEHETKLKENARLTSLPKRRAAGVNIASRGDGEEPTAPLGSIEDTIKSTLRTMRGRA